MALAARKIEPPVLMPEQIRERIATAKARHTELTARQMELAEQSVQSSDVEKDYLKTIDDMAAAQADIERLELALAGMEKKAAQKFEAEQLAEQAALRARVSKILDQRVPSAKAFEVAIADAVRAFREIVDLSDRAAMAWPGRQPEGGAALSNLEICTLVSSELFRQGHVAIVTGRPPTGRREPPPLPAPRAPSLEFIDMPDRVPSIVAQIEQANAFAKMTLES
jgi:hypothetical protein